MLTKLTCFLLLFTFIFLLISYLFELVLELWLHQGPKSSPSTRVLSASTNSPLDFGVDQLKLILGFRGIYCLQQFCNEKSNQKSGQQKEKLAELVATSGQVNHDELLQLRLESASAAAETESRQLPSAGRTSLKVFASAKLMEEEIDDSHIWLLYISHQSEHDNEPIVVPNVWPKLVRQFGKFDLRFARFDCKADLMYCHRRRWHSPRLVLVFPRSRHEVGKRIYNYQLESQTHSTDVTLWLQAQLSSHLSSIDSIDDVLLDSRVHPNPSSAINNHQLVKVVAIMGEQFRHSPPLSLSLLALRFRDRVTFGVHFARSADGSLAKLHAQLGTRIAPHLPIYLIVHNGRLIVYNADYAGPLSYSAMDAYLRGLILESNDLYLVLFALANLYLGLNFFWTRCMTTRRHLALCAVRAVEVNLLLLSITAVLWPLVSGSLVSCLALFAPQRLLLLTEQALSLAHCSLWSSAFAFHFRAQLLSPYSTERFFAAFILSGVVLVTMRSFRQLRRLFGSSHYDDELIKSVFHWASAIGCFAGFLLFRKSTRPARRRHHHSNVDFHDRADQQLRSVSGAAQSNSAALDRRPSLPASSDEWPHSEGDEEGEDEFELDEQVDLDSDLDRLLLESIFSGMAGNLWLQPELISTDYIHQLPVWQVVVKEEDEETLSQTAVEESSSTSSSTDVSDAEESSQRDRCQKVPSEHFASSAPSSSKAVVKAAHHTFIGAAEQSNFCAPKKPLNTKEAPQSGCCEQLADCAGGSSSSCKDSTASQQQISFQMRAKLEEKKRKIIRIRRKRSKRTAAATTVAATSTEVQQSETEKAADSLCLARPSWMLDFNDCTICLEAYRGAQAIIGLACGHNYHRDCLTVWLVRGNHCCPICRWPSYRLKHPRQTAVHRCT